MNKHYLHVCVCVDLKKIKIKIGVDIEMINKVIGFRDMILTKDNLHG